MPGSLNLPYVDYRPSLPEGHRPGASMMSLEMTLAAVQSADLDSDPVAIGVSA
jgi:hypothetical protein